MSSNPKVQQLIDGLFMDWHLRHIDAADAAHPAHLFAKGRVRFGPLAIRDELRPQVQQIYLTLQQPNYPSLINQIPEQLANLCEPHSANVGSALFRALYPLDNEALAELEVEERSQRTIIVVQLMLACAPYLDVTRRAERQAIVESIRHIDAYKSREVMSNVTNVQQILRAFVDAQPSRANAEGQIIAVAALGRLYDGTEEDTPAQLLRVAAEPSYSIAVRHSAIMSLLAIVGGGTLPDEEWVHTICQAACDFISGTADSRGLNLLWEVQFGDLARLIPAAGTIMLELLVHVLPENTSQRARTTLTKSILLFGRQALQPVLSNFRALNLSIESRPLAMTLKHLAIQDPDCMEVPVTISDGAAETTLFKEFKETVARNLPAAELAVQTIGQVKASEGRDLLWKAVHDRNAAAGTRSSSLWTLFEYAGDRSPGLISISEDWVRADDPTLKIVALLILATLGHREAEEQFQDFLFAKHRSIIKWLRGAKPRVEPILARMLDSSTLSRGTVAAELLVSHCGASGCDIVAKAYITSTDTKRRLMLITSLSRTPDQFLRRPDVLKAMAQALDGDADAAKIAGSIAIRSARVPR